MSLPLAKNSNTMLIFLEGFALFLLLLATIASYQSKNELLNIWGSKCQSNGSTVPATSLAIILAIAALVCAFSNVIYALVHKRIVIALGLLILCAGFIIAGVFIWLNAKGGVCLHLAG